MFRIAYNAAITPLLSPVTNAVVLCLHVPACSLVVNSAHLVDHVLTETEQAKALREMKFLDSGFDEMEFLRFMKEEYLPMIARAFFVYDEPLLKKVCREAALAQCKGAQANREVGALVVSTPCACCDV